MIFEQTQRTPYVELTPQSCAIRGECYPENIAEWSGPVLESLEKSLELGSDTFKVVIVFPRLRIIRYRRDTRASVVRLVARSNG